LFHEDVDTGKQFALNDKYSSDTLCNYDAEATGATVDTTGSVDVVQPTTDATDDATGSVDVVQPADATVDTTASTQSSAPSHTLPNCTKVPIVRTGNRVGLAGTIGAGFPEKYCFNQYTYVDKAENNDLLFTQWENDGLRACKNDKTQPTCYIPHCRPQQDRAVCSMDDKTVSRTVDGENFTFYKDGGTLCYVTREIEPPPERCILPF